MPVDRPNSCLLDAPPSAKLVFAVLERDGPLGRRELIAETRLHPDTVRDGVRALTDCGLVAVRPVPGDARRNTYRLRDEA
ncbi:MarR family transcriptional regulator [Halobacterium yunchengense]|uniref:MarR family transcriptional regulator n=1 Tax=Halobacterium yunchengense TaxID=3108497 RepID=UPI00300939C2